MLVSATAIAQPYKYKSTQTILVDGNSKFTVDQIKGCAPLTVKLNGPSCSPCGIKDGLGGAGQFFNQNINLQYNSSGVYKVLVATSGNDTNEITITVVDNVAPLFDISSCQGQVLLKINDTKYDSGYWVQYPNLSKMLASGASDLHALPVSTTPQIVKVRGLNKKAADNCIDAPASVVTSLTPAAISKLAIISATEIDLNYAEQANVPYDFEIGVKTASTFALLKTDVKNKSGLFAITSSIRPDDNDNYYCFRSRAIDKCSGTAQPYSNTVCSINLKANAINGENDLNWYTSPTGITDFSLTTNGTAQTRPNTPFSYADQNVICNTPYTYQLTANYSPTITSISLPKTVTSILIYTPGKLDYMGSEINATGNSVKLTWAPGVNPKDYQIFKATNTVSIGTTTTEEFTDDQYTVNACYKVRYDDNCDNTSDMSDEFCPLHLTGTLNKDNSALLSWGPYPGVTSYSIEKYDANGQLIQTITGITGITYTEPSPNPRDDQVYQYKVIAEQKPTLITSSNTIKVIKQPNIYYPHAFTPNNDNLNDSFQVIGQYVSAFEMRIFNRWGEMMFSTDNINEGWDGKYHGLAMPEGTYAFTAVLTDEIGRKFNRSGSVVLLHKNN